MRATHGIAVALSAGFRLATAAPCAGASTHLFVTTYPLTAEGTGSVITLKLDQASLRSVGESDACGTHPSWLTRADNLFYCVNEDWNNAAAGALAALEIRADFNLTKLGEIPTVGGPVSITAYGDSDRGLAVAGYGGGGIDTFNVENPKELKLLKSQLYPAPAENGTTDAQTQARPHQTILDPTGDFLVAPDLGADLLRVLKVNKETLEYTEAPSYEFARGTGPRHAVFLNSGDKTFLYLITEISNLVLGFAVTYEDEALSFEQVFSASTLGGTDSLPTGTAGAEITLSPDEKFITVSSRFDKSLEYTVTNGTTVPSDTLSTFSINAESGELRHVQNAPAGGVNPRSFSFNKDGSLVASALQTDSRIVVFQRNIQTGEIGERVTEVDVEGSPNFVIFHE